MKTCRICALPKEESEFHKMGPRGIRRGKCRACRKATRHTIETIVANAISTSFKNTKKRGHEHQGSDFLQRVYDSQDGRCAVTGVKFRADVPDYRPSPDRIDSSKGYVEGNVWWVCKRVNLMKMAIGYEELVEWARAIAQV